MFSLRGAYVSRLFLLIDLELQMMCIRGHLRALATYDKARQLTMCYQGRSVGPDDLQQPGRIL